VAIRFGDDERLRQVRQERAGDKAQFVAGPDDAASSRTG
jgi:hypothetical protein